MNLGNEGSEAATRTVAVDIGIYRYETATSVIAKNLGNYCNEYRSYESRKRLL